MPTATFSRRCLPPPPPPARPARSTLVLSQVFENEGVRLYVHQIQHHIRGNEAQCNEYKAPFLQYKALWTRDIDESLRRFLAENAPPPRAREDCEEDEDGGGEPGALGALAPRAEPQLALFEAEIATYLKQATAISTLPSAGTRGWLRVDSKPVKQALSTWVNKWQFRFTNYLQVSIEGALDELQRFVETINEGLSRDVEPDDPEALLHAMTCIRDVRMRTRAVNEIFEPLRGKVTLLKKYGVSLSEAYLDMLDQAPYQWEDTKKKTYNARERLGPLQSMRAEKIKEQAEDFGLRVADFRASFLAEAPFKLEVGEKCYELIDHWNLKIDEIEVGRPLPTLSP